MKKIKYFFMAIVCLMVSNVAKADDTPIPVSQLPAAAKTFLQANFPGINVIYAEKDWNTYECHLQDGTKVEFTRKGAWKKVDRERMAEYFGGTRPALSRALGMLRDRGLLSWRKNAFTIHF